VLQVRPKFAILEHPLIHVATRELFEQAFRWSDCALAYATLHLPPNHPEPTRDNLSEVRALFFFTKSLVLGFKATASQPTLDSIQAAAGCAETLLTRKGSKLGRDFSNSEEVLMVAKNLEKLSISTHSTGFKITPSSSKRLIFACAVFARWAHRLGHPAAKELLYQISARSGDSTYFLARIAQKATDGSDAHQIESMLKKVERSDCFSARKAKQRLLMIKWPKPVAALRIYLWFFKKRRQRSAQYRQKSLRDLNCLMCEAELKFPYSFRKQQRPAGSQSSLY
jgi:hypothetical protein